VTWVLVGSLAHVRQQ